MKFLTEVFYEIFEYKIEGATIGCPTHKSQTITTEPTTRILIYNSHKSFELLTSFPPCVIIKPRRCFIMKYDFTSIPDRSNCGSSKWDAQAHASVDAVPLSVADMEFPTAPEIKKELKKLIDNDILGYTHATDAFLESVCSWMKRRHDFDVKKEWIVNTPGVVNALGLIIEAATAPGDGIIILTPVYYPFDMAVVAKDRIPVYSKLINRNGHFEIDFEDLLKKASDKKNTAILFCNPHNPVGRVWTKDEIKRVADICCDNSVFIIDDEIHHDIIMPGHKHTVLLNASKRATENCAVCTAPSKTFNLAGLQCSNIIIPNDKIRTKTKAIAMINMQSSLNTVAYTACQAAYNKGEEWLNELITVINSNAEYVERFMSENIPEIKVSPLEGTYLLWIDMRELDMTHVEMKKMLRDADIFLDYGEMFGSAGRGYQRINIACSRETLEKTMERFKRAVEKAKKDRAENGAPYHKTLKKGRKLEGFVYDSANGEDIELSETIQKPTLIVFSRYYDCEVCQQTLSLLKKSHTVLKVMGYDIKVVIQSDIDIIKEAQEKYPFELIADPQAKLYDRFNIFEADSYINFIAGDKAYIKMTNGNIKNLLDTEMAEELMSAVSDSSESKNRELQLCALAAVDTDMNITYAYYSQTLSDFPGMTELVKALK